MLEKIAHLIKGKDAETSAAAFLKKQGLKIISRNQSYTVGEIDIIAEDDQSLVFVEVKYRSSNSHGTPAETVDHKKQQRLQRAALMWLQKHDPKMQRACRFDVIAISAQNQTDNEIEWIRDAF